MIKGLFQTHLNVADLERSMEFYGDVLALERAFVSGIQKARDVFTEGLSKA